MASGKPKKMTSGQVKKILEQAEKKQLCELLEELYKNCPDASDYLNILLGDGSYEAALLAEAKEKVRSGFFTRGGRGKLALSSAKNVIQGFENVCRNQKSVIDLQLYFVENAVELAGKYTGFPASFYRDTENMFRTVVRSIRESPDRTLHDFFLKRLAAVTVAAIGTNGGLQEAMENIYHELSRLENKKKETVRTPAGEILPEEDGRLFFSLWRPLLDFVNAARKINSLTDLASGKPADASAVKEISDSLWNDPSVIDAYIEEKGMNLRGEERQILSGWKHPVRGRFILERHLKNGSVFISAEGDKIYLVRGITTAWEEMFAYRPLPILLDATLIPFRDVIITDGLVMPMSVLIGSGMAKGFKEQYMTAKRRGEIIASLL